MRESERAKLWMSSAAADKRSPSHWTVLLIKKSRFSIVNIAFISVSSRDDFAFAFAPL